MKLQASLLNIGILMPYFVGVLTLLFVFLKVFRDVIFILILSFSLCLSLPVCFRAISNNTQDTEAETPRNSWQCLSFVVFPRLEHASIHRATRLTCLLGSQCRQTVRRTVTPYCSNYASELSACLGYDRCSYESKYVCKIAEVGAYQTTLLGCSISAADAGIRWYVYM
ncbi:hypothetical protein GGS26DRAFT_107523 [Hypomontagnella submonticulosa]|nr:hypothetical protein GGS26DRAFT_107523 [Hypomontagnella submonticulosa]